MDAPEQVAPDLAPPDPYADRAAIKDRAEKKHKAWTGPTRAGFLQSAKGNLLFKQGHHHVRPVGNNYGDWRPSVVKKGTPLPVTNIYSAVMKTFTSMLARFEPNLIFRPATEEPEDRATADVASRCIEVIQEEVQIVLIRQNLAEWVGHTGGAWLETGWDASMSHGVVNLPMDACTMCGEQQPMGPEPLCQACGGPTMEAPGITSPQARGKLFVDVRSVFEMIFDPNITDPTKHRILIRQSTMDEDDAKARWKDVADTIRGDTLAVSGTLTQDSLAVVTPNLGDMQMGSARTMWQSQGQNTSRVTESWYWELPSEAYPDGVLAIFLGKNFETCVHAGPLPYYAKGEGGQKDYFLPFVLFPQELVPGSAWPRTVANDVRPKNAQRNLLESLVIMALQRMANPVWLIANGSNVSNPTGEPGQILGWNSVLGAHAKPERIQGTQINPAWLENIARIDKEIQELTAIFEVLSGNRPEGISAGIALQILKERGESRFGPMFQLWHHAWATWAKQAIEIFRMFATEERVLSIKGRDGAWEVQKFLGADLTGRVNVVPEAGMAMPKSTMTDRAVIEQMAAMGVINPAANPEHNMAVLEQFGMLSVFMPSMEADAKRAIMENEAFEQMGAQPLVAAMPPEMLGQMQGQLQAMTQAAGAPTALAFTEQAFGSAGIPVPKVKPAIDDHAIHGREHRLFAKSERFDKLPPAAQQFVEAHIAAHDFLQGQQMMAAMSLRGNTAPNSGFNAKPGPERGSPPSTSPQRGASSQQGMDGQAKEMEDRIA